MKPALWSTLSNDAYFVSKIMHSRSRCSGTSLLAPARMNLKTIFPIVLCVLLSPSNSVHSTQNFTALLVAWLHDYSLVLSSACAEQCCGVYPNKLGSVPYSTVSGVLAAQHALLSLSGNSLPCQWNQFFGGRRQNDMEYTKENGTTVW